LFFRFGPGIGTLTVYLQNEGFPPVAIWTLSGKQPDDWFQGKAGFILHSDHSLLFEAKITSNDEGDIAIDDIAITNVYCATLPSYAIPGSGLTTTTTTTTMLVEQKTLNFCL
jgi:hypothetical protein